MFQSKEIPSSKQGYFAIGTFSRQIRARHTDRQCDNLSSGWSQNLHELHLLYDQVTTTYNVADWSKVLFVDNLSSLDVGPESAFGPGHLILWVRLQWLLGLRARGEGEPPHDGHHADLSLEEGKPHADAGAGTLAKSLEGVTKNEVFEKSSFFGFLLVFTHLRVSVGFLLL